MNTQFCYRSKKAVHLLKRRMRSITSATMCCLLASALAACTGGIEPTDPETPEVTNPSPTPKPPIANPGPDPVIDPEPDNGTPPKEPSQDIQAVMALPALNCTFCHDSTPGSSRVDLLTGSDEVMAARLVDVESSSPNCKGEYLIDSKNPSNSLMFKLVDPDSGSQCMAKMPFGADGVPKEYLNDFIIWMDDLIAISALLPDETDETPVQDTAVALDPITVAMKLKYLLHGEALTNQELNRISQGNGSLDTDALDGLVGQWLNSSKGQQKLKETLRIMLQIDNNDFQPVIGIRNAVVGPLTPALSESMIRTVMRIVNKDEDFRTVVTTRDWEVTTSVLAVLGYLDAPDIDRRGRELDKIIFDQKRWDFKASDYTDWRTVTLKQAGKNQFTYNNIREANYPNKMRAIGNGGSLSLYTPRVGFFNSLSFFAGWPTNEDNDHRVTLSQTLIATLGKKIEAGDPTQPHHFQGLPEEHTPQGSDCYGCHKNMDTMRNVFAKYYDVRNFTANDPSKNKPDFAFQGHRQKVDNMDQFAKAIVSHPYFATAWTLKVCQWLTSSECRNDPAVAEVAAEFEASNYNFKRLIRAVASSSLVTESSELGSVPGARVSISRQRHFCHTLESRMEGIRKQNNKKPFAERDAVELCRISSAAGMIPEAFWSRGDADMTQPLDADTVLARGYNSLCESVSGRVMTGKNASFDSSNSAKTIDQITEGLMGLPSNSPKYTQARGALQDLFDTLQRKPVCRNDAAFKASIEGAKDCGMGESQAVSLRQVWVAACQSPYVTGLGL